MICPVCEESVLSLIFDPIPEEYKGKYSCCCGNCMNKVAHKKNKSAAVHKCDSFNSHYDRQLGRYFSTREERNHYLKENNKISYGTDSPRESTKTRIICSKTQADRGLQGGKL